MRHGLRNTGTYRSWNSMLQRCTNPKSRPYKYYGGRGITVCAEWHDFLTFLRDMGPKPDGMSLDRIDNNKGYEPSNCRWANVATQIANRSCTIFVDLDGERMDLAAACAKLGIPRHPIYKRLARGWDAKDALSAPLQTAYPRLRREHAA